VRSELDQEVAKIISDKNHNWENLPVGDVNKLFCSRCGRAKDLCEVNDEKGGTTYTACPGFI
jgi:hypothetical protein